MRWPLVAAMFLLSSCGEPLSEQETESEFTPGPHQVDYHVSWDTEGVLLSDEGLELTNNLGYEIEVSAGYLVFYSTQLVPCEEDETGELARTQKKGIDWGKWWGRLIGIRSAHAGHGEEDLDASVVAQSYIEDLTQPVTQSVGSRTIEATRYCQIHYLVARGATGTLHLPPEQDMVGSSLYVQGTWRVDGSEPQDFTILSSVAYGTLSNLYPSAFYGAPDKELELDASQTGARVEIRRNLLGLFADVDFQTMSDTQLERRILQNVIEYTEFQVDLVP
jgi:hypothetical protein